MTLLECLYDEHNQISNFIDNLHQLCIKLMIDKNCNTDEFLYAVSFIRDYADKKHHLNEEKYLFKAMTLELGNSAHNIIQHGMLVEHDMARFIVGELEKSILSFKKDKSDENRLSIISYAMEYVHLLRRHIAKENTVIYPFAQRHLKKETIIALDKAFSNGVEYNP